MQLNAHIIHNTHTERIHYPIIYTGQRLHYTQGGKPFTLCKEYTRRTHTHETAKGKGNHQAASKTPKKGKRTPKKAYRKKKCGRMNKNLQK